ncbi:MAG: hypothetical protein WDN30_14630 [Pararobbsia sp.]
MLASITAAGQPACRAASSAPAQCSMPGSVRWASVTSQRASATLRSAGVVQHFAGHFLHAERDDRGLPRSGR